MRSSARVLVLVVLALTAPAAWAAPPPPEEPLSGDPAALGARLTEVLDFTNGASDEWLDSQEGTPSGEPREDIVLGALYQQRTYRFLARRPRLAAAVVARLPHRLRGGARDSVAGLRALFRLGGPPPPRPRRFRLGAALPPAVLRGYYDEAARRFGVPWDVLAAVNLVETNFNRIRSDSRAGARGPMQFLPSTWRAYGLGGDIRDPHDAILGAANYLRASGAPRNLRRALFAYNHSGLYVDAVLLLARRIRAGERGWIAMWSWQVFQRTPTGDLRLTGPE